MSIAGIDDIAAKRSPLADTLSQVPAWLWLAVGLFVAMFINGHALLNDSDTYWQIAVGQSILDHHTFPQADTFSFTKAGEPWISSSWLSQVLFAGAYRLAGWAGPVALAALAIALAISLVFRTLAQRLSFAYAFLVAIAAFMLATPHFLARPHVLVMPVIVLWARGLIAAADEKRAPSWPLLGLMVLWANLHGSFVFGLMLIAPFALETVWTTPAAQRNAMILRWAGFGVAALIATCATPYGWDALLAARKILNLGQLLTVISEWRAADFSQFGALEGCILVLIGGALYRGITLPPFRILFVLGLLHMALVHVRNIELFALLAPLAVASPVAAQLGQAGGVRASMSRVSFAACAAVVIIVAAATATLAAYRPFVPPVEQSPSEALRVLKEKKAERIFNDVMFGGYLIWKKMPVFIDGRAELYGEKFGIDFRDARNLQNVGRLLSLLEEYRIDATLLPPSAAAVGLLDRLDGWQRVYGDDNAVIHMRMPGAVAGDTLKLKNGPR